MQYFFSALADQVNFNYHDISGLKAIETTKDNLERPSGIHLNQSLKFALNLILEACNPELVMEEKMGHCICNPSTCGI